MKIFDEKYRWIKANFHAHTTLSDGRVTYDEAKRVYADANYDLLAVTDHRKQSPIKNEVYVNMRLISGIELDYMLEKQCIHVIGIGMTRNIELNMNNCGKTAQIGINAIKQAGGIAILAHPAWSLNTLDAIMPLTGLDAVEIYNSTSTMPWNAERADSSCFLDAMYTAGRILPVVASDDAHSYSGEQTVSATMINAKDNTYDSIMEALRTGKFYASTGVRISQIEVESGCINIQCEPAKMIVFFSNAQWIDKRVFVPADGEHLTKCTYKYAKIERYVRALIIGLDGRRAWTAPIRVNT